MIGPSVNIITAGHPLEPSQRRAATIGKPIAIERNVWIAAGATIIGGVTVGENAVVAAGSVVTKERSPEYPCRRESGTGHPFDWRRLNEHRRSCAAGMPRVAIAVLTDALRTPIASPPGPSLPEAMMSTGA